QDCHSKRLCVKSGRERKRPTLLPAPSVRRPAQHTMSSIAVSTGKPTGRKTGNVGRSNRPEARPSDSMAKSISTAAQARVVSLSGRPSVACLSSMPPTVPARRNATQRRAKARGRLLADRLADGNIWGSCLLMG
ncbi:uncharacterized protein BKA78DRAFT_366186, partial [Phyllosticta capitalensis]|uniref:uncharacterized protein n=1 Tax=Phyllosticta capitalensis TaxID=121624 RepID=UPI00312CC4C3